MRLSPILILCAALAWLVACAPGQRETGTRLFQRNCVACHGTTGAGDGPLARELPVPPANLRGLAAANDGVFPTADAMATIRGYRGTQYRRVMPEFGALLDSAPVIWTAPDGRRIKTPSALLALAEYAGGVC